MGVEDEGVERRRMDGRGGKWRASEEIGGEWWTPV
jgi:hypothetical protein